MIVYEGTPMGRKYPMGVIIIVIKSKRIVEQVESFARCIDKRLITCIVLKKLGRENMTRYVFKVLRSLEKILVEPIEMMREMVYIHEFAAVIDYVISKEGNMLMSEYQNSIFALVSQHEEMKGERWKEKFDYAYMF